MPLNFYYCKGGGFHAVIEERNEKFATEYFVYLMNEMLEPEKGISEKDVVCESVNIYEYKRRPTRLAPDRAKSARKSKPSASKRSKSGAAGKA